VINQKLADDLGLDDPVGTPAGHGWYHNDSLGTIIGVVENFHFNSLHFDVNTLAMAVHPEWFYEEMTVRLSGDDMQAAIADVRRIYDEQIADWPFNYSFLDEHFEGIYRSDQQMSSVVTIMAGLAIFIACLGLFGLAQLESQRRVKEVGIRKVLGATESQIMGLLSRNFAILVLIGFVVAVPVTYFALSGWLEGFAYRINLNWWVFPLAGILALLVAVGTITIHAYKSAVRNPVDSLRYE
jgi:putative ABC transport system permease protein